MSCQNTLHLVRLLLASPAYDARRDDTATKIVVNQEDILRH